jgi:hypothetical protein
MRIHSVKVALVHVLLVALALTAVAVWGTGADPARADRRVTVPDDDPRLPANPETVALVRPPGLLVADSAALKNGSPLGVLPELEAEVLEDAGVVMVKALVGREGDTTQGVWQFSVRDGDDPRAALRAIDELYAAGGWLWAPTEVRGVRLRAQKPTDGQPWAGYRAHYVRGPYLIRVEVYGIDQDQVDDAFAALATQQLAQWPPR